MAGLKKNYSFSSKRNIWRLIPTVSGFLVIEERDMNTRQVFFNCLNLNNGKILFKNLQLEEKHWIGIESVHHNLILFHKFRKPDMPGHKGIYAFDILNKKMIWQNDDLLFLFAKDDKVYAYQSTFEGRQHFVLGYHTGNVIEELGSEFSQISKLREEVMQNDCTNTFLYPKLFNDNLESGNVSRLMNGLLAEIKVAGKINWLVFKDLIMFNYHEQNSNGTFNNYFKVFDLTKQKYILNETLNLKAKNLFSESFFIVGDQLFLLVEKTELVVYRIMQ
jgi:hypothetical protein